MIDFRCAIQEKLKVIAQFVKDARRLNESLGFAPFLKSSLPSLKNLALSSADRQGYRDLLGKQEVLDDLLTQLEEIFPQLF